MGSSVGSWVIVMSMAVLASSASLDVDLCAKGEAIWCQSLEAAEVCSAVDHCTETIWKNQKLEKDESNVCLFCESVISSARQMSKAGKSQEEVTAFLSSASDLLPDSDKALQIKKTIDRKSIPKILNSDITPQMVCRLLDLCQGPQVELDLHKLESSPEEQTLEWKAVVDIYCQDCTNFFSALKKLATGPTTALVSDIIVEKVCSRTTTYKKQCVDVAKNYLNETIRILANFLDETMVCKAIRLCKNSRTGVDGGSFEVDFGSVDWEELISVLTGLPQPGRWDGPQQPILCTDCNNFFTSLKNFLQRETPPFITDILLDQVCARLKKGRQQCEVAVRAGVPSVITFAANFINPGQICQATRLCMISHQNSENDLNTIRWTKLILPNETNMLLNQPNSCPDCTKFFAAIRTLVKDDAAGFLSDVIIDQICPLTGAYRKQCEDLTKTYLPVAIGLVASTLDPDKLCKSIGMCKKSGDETEDSDLFVIDLSLIDWETLIGNLGDSKCDGCKRAVQFVQIFVKSESVKSTIAFIVDKFVCAQLGPFRLPCDKILATELRTVLDLLARLLDPSKVCHIIRLCKISGVFVDDDDVANDDSLPVLDQSEDLDVAECSACETVIGVVRAAIDTNMTKDDILKSMHGLCALLPTGSAVAVRCDRFASDYGQQVIKSIERKLQPKDICMKMELCNAFNFDLLDVAAVMGSEQCIVCRSTVQYLEALMYQTDTLAMIQGQLKTLCHSLPPTVEQDVCLPFVTKYIPQLIYELSILLPPKFFCTKIGICSD